MHPPQLQHCCAIAVLSQVALGCRGEPEACYGIRLGEQYDIELVERYDENSSYRDGPSAYGAGCGSDFDISVGDWLRIEVEKQRAHPANDCLGSLFKFTEPETYGWEILDDRHANQFPRLLLGQFDARVRGCEGILQARVEERDTPPNLFSVSEPGKAPYFILDRQFNTSCPATAEHGCGDQYVVTIHEVETSP